jgi:uncharacterized integral membrane protein
VEGRPKREVPVFMLVVFAALAIYAVLLIILNADEVNVSFVFFEARISLLILILLCLGIGFVAGFLSDQIRDRRKRRASS